MGGNLFSGGGIMKIRNTATALTAAVLLYGCGEAGPESLMNIAFGYSIEDYGISSRSTLESDGIEDRIESVSLFIYHNDRLIFSDYMKGDFSGIEAGLETGWEYDIYALVNMGDMRDAMPADRSSEPISDMVWNVPSYRQIDEEGLPMAGKLEGFKAGKDNPTIILKRLFAKICTEISFAYEGARVKEVRVLNLNGELKPFGTSCASASSSIMADIESDTGSGTYIFYVPENMQGEIGTASDAHEKNPDLDPAISAKKNVLTYMEVEVEMDGQGGYQGCVTYRSYLGNSTTRNFDIRGNCQYNWKLTYLEDNLQHDDWKIDTGDMSSDLPLPFLVVPGWSDQSGIEL